MPQVEAVKVPKHKRVKTVGIGVLVAIVLGLCGFAYSWWAVHRQSVTSVVAQADQLDQAGQYTLAYNKLVAIYPQAHTTADKIAVVSKLSTTSMDMGNTQEALRWYQQQELLEPNDITTLESYGALEEQLGMKSQAIVTYQHLISVEQNYLGGPVVKAKIAYYQQHIKDLQQ